MRIAIGEKSFSVRLVAKHANRLDFEVDGEFYSATLGSDPVAAAGRQPEAAPAQKSPTGSGTVTSPLPGVVTSILVKTGVTVAAGDTLCILEAMKMENPVTAPRAGTVHEIYVSVGAQMRAGEALLKII